MPADFDHNKIIAHTARSVLKPHGLFQKGSSRIWIDDNGWYLTVVEFQPSGWGKGTYLNVGIHFLLREQDYLSFDFGGRMKEFVSAEDPERFSSDMEELAVIALDKVMEYRKFRDVSYAQKQMRKDSAGMRAHRLYNQMMVCGLMEDRRALRYHSDLWEQVRFSAVAHEIAYRQELAERIDPIVADKAAFKVYILSKIQKQRNFWHSKSSMKKVSSVYSFL